MIRHLFGVDPNTLGLEQWAELYAEAAWIKGFEMQNQIKATQIAVLEALQIAFAKKED